ncbi:MAG: hypothetical protein NTZ20_00960 [Candidatus Levybacteria bacterium]|nr:hypothetical protein [Candidatus Levybacteria bacterium]
MVQDAKQTKKVDPKAPNLSLDDQQVLIDFVKNSSNVMDLLPRVNSHLKQIINETEVGKKYQIVFLHDQFSSINDYTSDRIYRALSKSKDKDVLLVLSTTGGQIEPAYLISKCCKEYSKEKFVVVIPRRAKSAGTLLALGADEIHMGSMSQLGPIDPQIGGLPALGLSNAVEYIAMFCKRWPESSDMFAKYLSNKLDLRIFGYFERVAESAVHYAVRLLGDKKLPDTKTAQDVASALVYSYKDHNFVIDKSEAKQLLGDIVTGETDEYALGDKIYKFLEMLQLLVFVFHKKQLSLVGNADSGIEFSDVAENQ